MKDGKSLLLVLLSIGMVGTWVYHLYDKSQYSNQPVIQSSVRKKDSLANNAPDSSTIFATPMKEPVTPDTLQQQLSNSMALIKRLQSEAKSILRNSEATKADLAKARSIILEMRTRMDQMALENVSLQEEKKILTAKLDQLNVDMKGITTRMKTIDEENVSLKDNVRSGSVFMASEVRVAAIDLRNGESETNLARKTNKLAISFIVQNNITQTDNAELFVVIKDPSGNVIQNDQWQARTFATQKEGEKKFTRKLSFAYEKGEQKRVILPLELADFSSGAYKVEVYHNGVRITQGDKVLK